MLPMGTDRPSQATGTGPAELGTQHIWRPAEPAHTYPIVSGTNLRSSMLPAADHPVLQVLPRGAFPGTVQDKDISSGTSGPSHGRGESGNII